MAEFLKKRQQRDNATANLLALRKKETVFANSKKFLDRERKAMEPKAA